MRSMLAYMMLPLAALAATAIPVDPVRAATHCPRAAALAKPAPKAALVETREIRKLEAL